MQAHLWEKAREAKDTAVRLLGGIPPEQLPTLLCALASLYEVKRDLSLKAFDSLTLDYSPNQPRDRYGRWSNGGITKGLTGGEESGKLKSSQKVIGKNGGTLKAEDMPEIKNSKGQYLKAQEGTTVIKIYTFAGKGANKPLRVETQLLKQYGGKRVSGSTLQAM